MQKDFSRMEQIYNSLELKENLKDVVVGSCMGIKDIKDTHVTSIKLYQRGENFCVSMLFDIILNNDAIIEDNRIIFEEYDVNIDDVNTKYKDIGAPIKEAYKGFMAYTFGNKYIKDYLLDQKLSFSFAKSAYSSAISWAQYKNRQESENDINY